MHSVQLLPIRLHQTLLTGSHVSQLVHRWHSGQPLACPNLSHEGYELCAPSPCRLDEGPHRPDGATCSLPNSHSTRSLARLATTSTGTTRAQRIPMPRIRAQYSLRLACARAQVPGHTLPCCALSHTLAQCILAAINPRGSNRRCHMRAMLHMGHMGHMRVCVCHHPPTQACRHARWM